EKYFEKKKYLHFDWRRDFDSAVEKYVIRFHKIAIHSFLPLINYVDMLQMYWVMLNPAINNHQIKEKPLDIMFAGHLDSYIYTYYSLKLNDLYNNWTENNDIDTCSIAYRTNKKGLSSINFAAEVVNRIVNYEEAFILV